MKQADGSDESSFAPPEALANRAADRKASFTAFQVLDKGKTQLAFSMTKVAQAFTPTPVDAGAFDAQLTPPETIAQFDKADLGVRFPDLNGDGFAWTLRTPRK